MGNESALDEVTAVGGVITDQHPLDFHTLGLAGCIDRLTAPFRHQGTAVHWDTPHWGIEIPADCASLLYQAAREALSNALKYSDASAAHGPARGSGPRHPPGGVRRRRGL